MFDRIDFLTRYAWLTQLHQPMIIGNDLDGLLSAQFLHDHLGWTVAGFYNYSALYHDPAVNPLDCTWVDLDIYHPRVGSIGHHILRPAPTDRIVDHQLTVNPNLLRGIDQTDFMHKYPLGTIHFLLWLHDRRIVRQRAAILLLWLADSAWINAQHYRPNVQTWLREWLPVPELVDTFDETNTGGFEEDMRDQVLSAIDGTGLAGADNIQRRSKHLNLGGHQCVWNKPEEVLKVRRVTALIERRFGWKQPDFPREFKGVEGHRRSAALPELVKRHGSFDAFLANERVFSYVIPNRDRINYTTGLALGNP
jgi:hypothetical protein